MNESTYYLRRFYLFFDNKIKTFGDLIKSLFKNNSKNDKQKQTYFKKIIKSMIQKGKSIFNVKIKDLKKTASKIVTKTKKAIKTIKKTFKKINKPVRKFTKNLANTSKKIVSKFKKGSKKFVNKIKFW